MVEIFSLGIVRGEFMNELKEMHARALTNIPAHITHMSEFICIEYSAGIYRSLIGRFDYCQGALTLPKYCFSF